MKKTLKRIYYTLKARHPALLLSEGALIGNSHVFSFLKEAGFLDKLFIHTLCRLNTQEHLVELPTFEKTIEVFWLVSSRLLPRQRLGEASQNFRRTIQCVWCMIG